MSGNVRGLGDIHLDHYHVKGDDIKPLSHHHNNSSRETRVEQLLSGSSGQKSIYSDSLFPFSKLDNIHVDVPREIDVSHTSPVSKVVDLRVKQVTADGYSNGNTTTSAQAHQLLATPTTHYSGEVVGSPATKSGFAWINGSLKSVDSTSYNKIVAKKPKRIIATKTDGESTPSSYATFNTDEALHRAQERIKQALRKKKEEERRGSSPRKVRRKPDVPRFEVKQGSVSGDMEYINRFSPGNDGASSLKRIRENNLKKNMRSREIRLKNKEDELTRRERMLEKKQAEMEENSRSRSTSSSTSSTSSSSDSSERREEGRREEEIREEEVNRPIYVSADGLVSDDIEERTIIEDSEPIYTDEPTYLASPGAYQTPVYYSSPTPTNVNNELQVVHGNRKYGYKYSEGEQDILSAPQKTFQTSIPNAVALSSTSPDGFIPVLGEKEHIDMSPVTRLVKTDVIPYKFQIEPSGGESLQYSFSQYVPHGSSYEHIQPTRVEVYSDPHQYVSDSLQVEDRAFVTRSLRKANPFGAPTAHEPLKRDSTLNRYPRANYIDESPRRSSSPRSAGLNEDIPKKRLQRSRSAQSSISPTRVQSERTTSKVIGKKMERLMDQIVKERNLAERGRLLGELQALESIYGSKLAIINQSILSQQPVIANSYAGVAPRVSAAPKRIDPENIRKHNQVTLQSKRGWRAPVITNAVPTEFF